jgi:phage terminase large subunit-like protein
MKFFTKYCIGFVVATLLIGVGLQINGCATTSPSPTIILTEANDTLAVSETVLTAADKAGLIPASDRAAIAAAVSVAQKDLAVANANSGASMSTSILAQVQTDLDAVVQLRLKYSTPTTQPAK